MITVYRNGTKTTFRHYRIQDIARFLDFFLQVIFVEGNFTNKLGVFASSISWKLPFRTRTHTHTHTAETCRHMQQGLLFDGKFDANCGSSNVILHVWPVLIFVDQSNLQIHLPETETQQNLHWFHVISNLRTLHIFMLRLQKQGQYPHGLLCGKLTWKKTRCFSIGNT